MATRPFASATLIHPDGRTTTIADGNIDTAADPIHVDVRAEDTPDWEVTAMDIVVANTHDDVIFAGEVTTIHDRPRSMRNPSFTRRYHCIPTPTP